MNHLAHFTLAPLDDAARIGTLLGDFVRGSDLSAWPVEVEQAIRLHRRIDAFTDSHALIGAARQLLPPEWRRHAGIALDVYFDHLLIANWGVWHAEALATTSRAVYASLARHAARLPDPARTIAMRMGEFDTLLACASETGVARVLQRISTRLKRPVALDAMLPALVANRRALADLFARLYPELQEEARRYLAGSTRNTRPSGLSVSR